MDINRKYSAMRQYGNIGQRRYGGIFYEEFLRELQGRSGIEVYREMSSNDSTIGAMLFAIEMLVRQTKFDVEAAGTEKVDLEACEFVKSCMNDMSETWQDALSEILTFITYGWSAHELLYKRRNGRRRDSDDSSKYSDGLIGWKSLPIRSQDTLYRWEYDADDNLLGLTQMAPPHFRIQTIPISKLLLFRTRSRKANPEGVSILRSCYRDWYFKKRMQEIEGIGVERDLAGLPMMQPTEDYNPFDGTDEGNAQIAMAQQLVTNVRRDALEGLVIPPGWTFQLLSGGSSRQFEVGSIIERYDRNMARSVMADFIFLGAGRTGSYALSSDKTELFGVALGTYLDIICDVFNTQGIPRLIDLNGGHFSGISDYPKMVHGDVEKPDLAQMSAFIEKMVGAGLLQPDENIEKYVRRLADLPDAIEGDPGGEAGETQPQGPNVKPGENEAESGGDGNAAEAVKKAWLT